MIPAHPVLPLEAPKLLSCPTLLGTLPAFSQAVSDLGHWGFLSPTLHSLHGQLLNPLGHDGT